MKSGNPPPADLPADLHPLWVASVRANDPPGRLELAAEAFRLLVRLRQIQGVLATEGLTVTSKRSGMTRAHPLLSHETALRKQFAKVWRDAGFHHNVFRGTTAAELEALLADLI